jgi:ATP-binding cassette subfamily B protein
MYVDNSKTNVLKVVGKTIKLSIKTAPLFATMIFLVGIFSAVSQGLITLQTQRMFESAIKLLSKETLYITTAWQCVLLCLVIILAQLLNGFHNYVYDLYINVMKNRLTKKMQTKVIQINPVMFEDSDFLNMANQAKVGLENSIEVTLILGDIFTYYIPYFLFMGLYLYAVKPAFLFVLLLIFIPVLLAQVIRMKLYGQLENKSAHLRRKMAHYEECVSDIAYLKETRIASGVSYFRNKFITTLKLFNNNITHTSIKTNRYEVALDLVTLAGYIYILWMLVTALFNREISVGAFSAIYVSISSMFGMMEEIIRYNIGNIAENIGTLDNFVRFFDYDSVTISEDSEDYSQAVVLENVSFKYPNSEQFAINSINLTINPNETIAIVGENGSGKSTLVNLIVGLYHPSTGSISVGVNQRMPKVLHYKGLSAVFQKFQKYKLNMEDNIRLSDFKNGREDDDYLKHAGVDMLYTKHKDTIMSTEFDGIDLSIGQWQRIAIARAIYKDYDLIALDEPTASIDALEEDALYQKFEVITKGKTAVIVTHHLGSISFANRIIVMNQGAIAEEGSHKELMMLNGIYQKMFVAQSENYLNLAEKTAF